MEKLIHTSINIRGKSVPVFVIAILALLGTLGSCCGITMILPGKETPEATPETRAQEVAILEEATATITPASTYTPAPTDTPEPTSTSTRTPTATPEPTPERQEAQVVRVIDGDTIEVQIGNEIHTVRYIGIDTPETVHPSKPVEWMGPEASAANAELVEGETVYLEKDVSETDQYDRLLRYVYLADGTFVNAELVRRGYAQASTYPPDVKYQEMFIEAQAEAREEEVGLWGPTPTPQPTNTPAPTLPPTNTPAPTQPPQPTELPQPTEPPQPTPQPTEPPAPPAAAPGDVQITSIFYDGVVKRVESDEYAVIQNVGGSPVNLAGWRLNAGNPGQDFGFPGVELQPGQACRVYTNESHPESCGFSFGSGQALWNNGGDCGYLFNSAGEMVSQYCY